MTDVNEAMASWPLTAQYVVLLATAPDRDTIAAVLESAMAHVSDAEFAVLEHFSTRRERELGKVYET